MKLPSFLLTLSLALPAAAETHFLEAEAFASHGGWTLDTQFIEIMGSPYLIAHGLGKPVADAKTKLEIKVAGEFTVWARTKDWVASWNAPGSPGKFQILANGAPLAETLGTKGAEWHWQKAGTVKLTAGQHEISLKDLTGFNGRCDALVLTTEAAPPPDEASALRKYRRDGLDLPANPPETEEYHLVVVGGGYSGMGAAISAARQGLRVALLQNRPVLGGNGSSEIQVWAQGGTRRGLFPHLGEIVEEFADRAANSPGTVEEYGDAHKEKVIRSEKNIQLYLNTHAVGVGMEQNGSTRQLRHVLALDTKTGRESVVRGRFFVDATGHGSIGALTGASYHLQEKDHMGMSNMWSWGEAAEAQAFPKLEWALPLELEDFPPTKKAEGPLAFWKGEWFWESGFNRHPIDDLEHTRDWNLRAVFGAFSAMKNGPDAEKYAKAKMQWVACIGGTRESRMIEGDIKLTEQDIVSGKIYPDACVPTTWDIDLHYAKEQYAKKFPQDPFISRAAFGKGVDKNNGYPLPYRCFYSKDVPNLFMAGRCISVTHEALGTVRVMRTCGMMGEVVGKAAAICIAKSTTPRGVYEKHLDELKELMKLPGAARRETVDGKIMLPETPTVFPPSAGDKGRKKPGLNLTELPGIAVDDTKAKFTGNWTEGEGLKGFVGTGYHHSNDKFATAVYSFTVPKSGRYEVRLAWQPHENRASNTACEISNGKETKTVSLNQKEAPTIAPGFTAVATMEFASETPGQLTLSVKGSNGTVHADAVWLSPVP